LHAVFKFEPEPVTRSIRMHKDEKASAKRHKAPSEMGKRILPSVALVKTEGFDKLSITQAKK